MLPTQFLLAGVYFTMSQPERFFNLDYGFDNE